MTNPRQPGNAGAVPPAQPRSPALKRALLIWEMGEGLGHVSQLLDTARRLKAQGWEIVYAGRELHSLHGEVLKVADWIVPSPYLLSLKPAATFRAASFADILAQYGFGRIETLHPILSACDGLIHFVQPSVIIGDFAPFIALAAFRKVPMISIGASFCNPPSRMAKFPRLTEGPGFGLPEAQLLDNVREVQRRRGRPEPSSLPEAVGGDAQFVLSFPEFDLYAKLRQTPACGPTTAVLKPLPPPSGEARLFVYLNYLFPPARNLLRALCQSPVPVFGFVRDCPPEVRKKIRENGLDIRDQPLPMEQALTESRGIVHHAGAGTLHEAASAGRPQLLFPIHMEQAINARLACQAGIAQTLRTKADPEEWRQAIAKFVADESLATAARRISAEIEKRQPFRGLEQIVAVAERLAAEAR